MFTLQFIKNKDADSSIVRRLIALKQTAWPYPYESQIEWMQTNLKTEDIHVILIHNDTDVAYLNLCDVCCNINDQELQCKGIGNVCSAVKGMGYGNKLMSLTNQWLKENHQIGLLFCHCNVEPFYQKCGWEKISAEKCEINGITPEIFTYAYNIPHPIYNLKYTDRLF